MPSSSARRRWHAAAGSHSGPGSRTARPGRGTGVRQQSRVDVAMRGDDRQLAHSVVEPRATERTPGSTGSRRSDAVAARDGVSHPPHGGVVIPDRTTASGPDIPQVFLPRLPSYARLGKVWWRYASHATSEARMTHTLRAAGGPLRRSGGWFRRGADRRAGAHVSPRAARRGRPASPALTASSLGDVLMGSSGTHPAPERSDAVVPVVTLAALYGARGRVSEPRVAERLGVLVPRPGNPGRASPRRCRCRRRPSRRWTPPSPKERAERSAGTSRAWAATRRAPTARRCRTRQTLGGPVPVRTDRVLARATVVGGVVLGRGGAVVLGAVPGVLHVRLGGPAEARIRRRCGGGDRPADRPAPAGDERPGPAGVRPPRLRGRSRGSRPVPPADRQHGPRSRHVRRADRSRRPAACRVTRRRRTTTRVGAGGRG